MPKSVTNDEIAQLAYSAYGQATGGKNFRGGPMPKWDDLPFIIQMAWEVAAIAVKNAVNQPGTCI